MARRPGFIERFSFGGRVPGGVGFVAALTVVASLACAFGNRHTLPLFELAALAPAKVVGGEVWRLVTWVLVEPSPLRLLFDCLFLYWFGRDLAEEWGSRRFLAVYFGFTLLASIGTCAVGLVDPPVRGLFLLGSWPLAAAVTVAWGLYFPERVIRLWFVLPLRGYVLAWLTVALTGIFAIYDGWEPFLPALIAEGGMLAWLFRRSISTRVAAMQQARRARSRADVVRVYDKKRKSSAEVLRSLEAKDDELAPLPPELEDVLAGKRHKPSK